MTNYSPTVDCRIGSEFCFEIFKIFSLKGISAIRREMSSVVSARIAHVRGKNFGIPST